MRVTKGLFGSRFTSECGWQLLDSPRHLFYRREHRQ